jgi:hypothetical protein
MEINKKRSDAYAWAPRAVLIDLGGIGAWAGFYGFFHG